MPREDEVVLERDSEMDALAEELMNEFGEEESTVEETEDLEETEEESEEETEEESEEDTEDESEEQPEDPEETEEAEEEQEDVREQAPNQSQKKGSNAKFAEMRVANKNMAHALEISAKAAGFSNVEEFVAAQEKALVEAEAKKNNIPVEVYEKIQKLEQENEARNQEQLAMRFDSKAKELMSDFNVGPERVAEFVDKCFAAGITDLHNDALDLKALYQGFYFNDFMEAERQKWIAKDSKNRSTSSTVPGGRGKTSIEGKRTIESYEEFEKVLDDIKI